jgi:hypothetical protein
MAEARYLRSFRLGNDKAEWYTMAQFLAEESVHEILNEPVASSGNNRVEVVDPTTGETFTAPIEAIPLAEREYRKGIVDIAPFTGAESRNMTEWNRFVALAHDLSNGTTVENTYRSAAEMGQALRGVFGGDPEDLDSLSSSNYEKVLNRTAEFLGQGLSLSGLPFGALPTRETGLYFIYFVQLAQLIVPSNIEVFGKDFGDSADVSNKFLMINLLELLIAKQGLNVPGSAMDEGDV